VSAADGRTPVAVLGATGAVGQTFIRLLDGHPLFRVAEVAASERSAGRSYVDATHWHEGTLPDAVAGLDVVACEPSAVTSRVVFSALDSSVAGEVEAAFARAGAMVLSNAKNYRMDADVPLVIPEVNASHLDLLESQRSRRGWDGAIVTNANCAATVAALALAPLHEAFGLRRVFATTLQAVSGAGYPGVPSLDILGNVIPFIGGAEEEKIETELPKLLGRIAGDRIEMADFAVSAMVNRVPVEHGHTVCMSVELRRAADPEEAARVLDSWKGDPLCAGLPSAPDRPVVLSHQPNRPQPRKDAGEGRGMTVVVGRVRPDPILHLRLVAMGHNTIRGAAGGSVLNAEVLARKGVLPG
jgi:aspartate-semialdehyde dehydrogenase